MIRKIDSITITLSLVILVFISGIFYLKNKDVKALNFEHYQNNFEKLKLLNNDYNNFLHQSLNFTNYDFISAKIEKFDDVLLNMQASNIQEEFHKGFKNILKQIRKNFEDEYFLLEYHKSLNSVSVNSINYLFDLRSQINNDKSISQEQKNTVEKLLFSLMQLFSGLEVDSLKIKLATNSIYNYTLKNKNDYLLYFYTQTILLQKNIILLNAHSLEHENINLLDYINEAMELLQSSYKQQTKVYQLFNFLLIAVTILLLLTLIILHRRILNSSHEMIAFRYAVQNSDNSIEMTDTDRKITYVNESFERNTGYTKEEVLGRNPNVLNEGLTDQSVFIDMYKSLEESKPWKGEFINTRKDGSIFYESATIMPIIIDGELVSYLAIKLDITAYIEQKEELLEIQKELETLVDERTIELKLKAQKLEDTLSNLKKYQKQLVETEKMSSLGSLVSGVAHEINTPLGISITGSTHIKRETQIILNAVKDNDLQKSDFLKYLATVDKMSSSMYLSLNRAADLVRSFKQVAIDQHSERKRNFNLKDYCDEVLLSLHSQLKQETVLVKNEINENININSYAGIFSQILTNFIMNSLLHAFAKDIIDAKIIINAWIENGSLYFIYEDNGLGIDDSYIKKVFDPFFTTKLGQGGSGLGLNIIYNLINHKLKGDIYCINQERGIKMIITLPMNELQIDD